MRHLKCFVLNTLCSKTKHLRRLARGFQWLEILGLRIYLSFLSGGQTFIHIIAVNHSVNKTILNCSKKIIQKLLNDCSGSINQCQTKLFLCKTKTDKNALLFQFETIKKTIGEFSTWNLDLQNWTSSFIWSENCAIKLTSICDKT